MPNKNMNDFEKYWSCRNMIKFMSNIAACESYTFDDKNNVEQQDESGMYKPVTTQNAADIFSAMCLAMSNHLQRLDGAKCFEPDPGLDEIEIPKGIDQPPRGAKPKPAGFVKQFMDVPYSDN